jgi:predicted AlkP superfamily phosphohydrolase/phosphomutase
MLAVLAMDGTSPALLERLVAEGKMPVLGELHQQGSWYPLETPATHFSEGVYHTLYSGKEIGEHGLYFPFQWSAAEQRLRHSQSFSAPEAVWERLARAGRRSLVLDPYDSHPPRATAGAYLSGWQLTNRFTLRRQAAPDGLDRRLARRFGHAPRIEEVFGRNSPSRLAWVRRKLVDGPQRAAVAVTSLLASDRFDLVWVGFPALHLAGHQLWDLSQLLESDIDMGVRAELEAALEEIYVAGDTAIGRILAALPADADLILCSTVGMDVDTSRADLLPEMLERILQTVAGRTRGRGPGAGSWIWRLRGAVSPALRRGLARPLPDKLLHEVTARLAMRGIDWYRTPAFALPTPHEGYVRLNLRGREREGIIDAGEADALLDAIAEGLATFRDSDGPHCIAGVDRVSELVRGGAEARRLPDLVVRWSTRPSTRLEGVTSPLYGDVVRRAGTGRSGNHTADAWVLVIARSSSAADVRHPARVTDIAATIATVLEADTHGLAGHSLLAPR